MAEPDINEVDALLDSLNGSAERFQTLWFSFLGLTLYLAIAALATTHRNLLLGEPQVLPILNIKVELLPFYVIAPLLYLVFHFYVLMMLVLLARTAATFEEQLRITLPIESDREQFRARVENALFLQMLVGMKQERAGFNGFLLSLIALITIVAVPLATLILMQMMFLPYHSLAITWWHRILVLADLVFLIVMWGMYSNQSGIERPPFLFRHWDRQRNGLALAANICLIAVALWLSFWEGRWAGEPYVGRAKLHARGVVWGLFPDRLILWNEIVVGESRLEDIGKETASRGRSGFVPARNFGGRDLQGAVLAGADLRGVALDDANVQGADLAYARLDGALLQRAQLQGADLSESQLQGADLDFAQLQGAHLASARLQGAQLAGARLQGADLRSVHMQGAYLIKAQLQAANLIGARLQGADLAGAQLQGASLAYSYLQGADLREAQLQGANLGGVEAADSEFDGTFVARADLTDAKLNLAAIRSVRADMVKSVTPGLIEPLTPADVGEWIAEAAQFVDDSDKATIAPHFDRLKSTFATADKDAADKASWSRLAESTRSRDPDGANHRSRLATIIGDLACNADGAPYVALATIVPPSVEESSRLAALGDQVGGVKDRLKAARKNPETCPGVASFSGADWARLDVITTVKAQDSSKTTPPAYSP